MRELAKRGGKRSGEARRRKREQRQAGELEPANDREQAKVALRRALDGNNSAAMVAAAKALIEFDRSPDREHVTVEDARAALAARLDAIAARRREHAEECTACGGRGYIPKEHGRGPGPRNGGERGGDDLPPAGPTNFSGEPPPAAVPPPVPPASVAGRPGGENPRLSAEATWNLRSRSFEGWAAPNGDDDPDT
jgi:hypothetical protein